MKSLLLPNQNFISGLNIFLSILVEKYFDHSYCGCLIKRENHIGDIHFGQLPILIIDYEEKAFGDHFLGCVESACSTFFVMADVFQEFHDNFLATHDKAEQRVAEKYVLVISEKPEIPQYRLDLLVMQEIPNCLYLSNKYDKTFELLTFDDALELRTRDSFNVKTELFQLNTELYPSFENLLTGRAVRVAAIFYLPNAYFKQGLPGEGQAYNISDPNDEKSILMDGTESRVILELCRRYNCTINMNFVEGMWGGVDENGNGSGMIGSLLVHETDVGYAALYPWQNVVKFLSVSAPISKNEVTCLVPRPKLRPYYLTPILPFPLICWIGLFVSFLALMLSMKLITSVHMAIDPQNTEDTTWTGIVFTIVAVFLLQTYKLGNEKLSKVLIFCVLVIIGIVLDNIYSGGLAAVLTMPQYEKPIDSVLDLLNAHLPWAGTQDVWIFSLVSSTQPTILQLLKAYSSIETEELLKRSTQGNIAIVLERAQFGHVAVEKEYVHIEGARMLQLMRDEIYWEYIVMYSPKTFPFTNVLNNMILSIAQTGIQSYWEIEVFANYVDQEIQQTILHAKDKPDNTLVRLQLGHFLGAFFLLGFGCFNATLVFSLELVVDRWRRMRSNDVWVTVKVD